MRFELQAAQYIGQMAAEFARVNRVAPDFCERIMADFLALVLAQLAGNFGLATGHQHDELRFLFQSKMDRIIGRRIAGMQRGHHIDCGGQLVGGD